ncbi:MAG: hypothetical protein RLO01_11195 [Thalassobaculaceae bacterium]
MADDSFNSQLTKHDRFLVIMIAVASIMILVLATAITLASHLPLFTEQVDFLRSLATGKLVEPAVIEAITKNAEASSSNTQNLLLTVLPLSVVLMSALFGFMGMRRLQIYDQEIRHLRDSIETRERSLKEDIQTEIRSRVIETNQTVADFLTQSRGDLEGAVRGVREAVDGTLNEFAKAFSEIQEANRRGQSSSGAWNSENTEDHFAFDGNVDNISNTRLAYEAVRDLFTRKQQATAIEIADRCIELNLPGSASDSFNLATVLARNGFPDRGLKALETAFHAGRFIADPDNLGLAIHLTTRVGSPENGREYFSKLENIDQASWTRQTFIRVYDWLTAIGDESRAEAVLRQGAEEYPDDDLLTTRLTDLLHKLYGEQHALEFAKKALTKSPKSPRLIVHLIDALRDKGDYAAALQYAHQAREATALDQSPVSESAIYLTLGHCYEGRMHQLIGEKAETDKILEYALLAMDHYLAAVQAPDRAPFVIESVQYRRVAMCLGLSRYDLPVDLMRFLRISGPGAEEAD